MGRSTGRGARGPALFAAPLRQRRAERALIARATQTTAIAVAYAEKAQWSFYEGRVGPADKLHPPWIEPNDKQVLAGFEHLDAIASKGGRNGWIAGTTTTSQADVTTAIAYTFASTVRPGLNLAGRFHPLSQLTRRCEALPAFLKAPVPSIPR